MKKQETRVAHIIIRLYAAHDRALIHRFSRTGDDATTPRCRRCCSTRAPVPICPSIHGESVHFCYAEPMPVCTRSNFHFLSKFRISNTYYARFSRVAISMADRRYREIQQYDPPPGFSNSSTGESFRNANNEWIESSRWRNFYVTLRGKQRVGEKSYNHFLSSIFHLDKILVKFPTT